jgi:hypothetical protein
MEDYVETEICPKGIDRITHCWHHLRQFRYCCMCLAQQECVHGKAEEAQTKESKS